MPTLSDVQLCGHGAAAARVALSYTAAAELLSVSRRTVERLVASGELPHVRIAGRLVRIALSDVEAYVAARRTTSSPPTSTEGRDGCPNRRAMSGGAE